MIFLIFFMAKYLFINCSYSTTGFKFINIFFKLVTRIFRAVKRATLMLKSSPRLSKQVDCFSSNLELLNLVGIYVRVYI